jgi:hypothetical protein
MMEDLDGLDVAWNWFVGVFNHIGNAAVWLWDLVETWPLPVRLVLAGVVGAMILMGVLKK